MARTLNKSERNYSATKRELLAVVNGLKKCEEYLLGRKFFIITDHKPLTFLHSQKRLADLHMTWAETLSKFNLEIIINCPGKDNILPDLLSRLMPDNQSNNSVCTLAAVSLMEISKERKNELLQETHQLAHGSSTKLLIAILRRGINWSSLKKDCEDFCNNCQQCIRYNLGKSGVHPLKSILSHEPMHHIAIDLIGPLPCNESFSYIFVAIDVLSRYIYLQALPS